MVKLECGISKSGSISANGIKINFLSEIMGCGIDRLCMLLNNVTSIREVILFPTMKPIICTN